MTKQQSQTVPHSGQRIKLISVSIIAVISLVLGTTAFYRAQAAISYADENFIKLSRTNSKLNFCIDNNISPCRYETIMEWNNKHSADERFNIQPND